MIFYWLIADHLSKTSPPPIAVMFCVLCMPKAFCGLEMCAKKLRELCALCERKNSPASLKNVLFLTENTEEQSTQHSKQVVAPPPSPPPKGRGVITEIPL